jgi:hypothetical protein
MSMRYLFQAGVSPLFAISTDKGGGNIKSLDTVPSWILVSEITQTRLRCQDSDIEGIVNTNGYCLLDGSETKPFL